MQRNELYLDESYRTALICKVQGLLEEMTILEEMLLLNTEYMKALKIIQHINAIKYHIIHLNDNFRKFLRNETCDIETINQVIYFAIDILSNDENKTSR